MKINVNNIGDLKLKGVYTIVNLVNNRQYIGSSTMSFGKRLEHHISLLRRGTHKNKHLQRAFNKYSEEKFEFNIIEICEKEDCLIREQFYINQFNFDDLYNINPLASGTPNMSEETILRRTATLKQYWLDNGTDRLKGRTPWNKGQNYESTDHLKVPKKFKNGKPDYITPRRKQLSPIYVYKLDLEFLGKWNNSKELQEYSISEFCTLPIESRCTVDFRGVDRRLLQSTNINKCANGISKSYKGLIFSYLPLHSEMNVENGANTKEGENPNIVVN